MNKSKSKSNQNFSKAKKDRMVDVSKHDDLIFNRTPILSSALKRLQKNESKGKLTKEKILESNKRPN
jgi:hypothetical protein